VPRWSRSTQYRIRVPESYRYLEDRGGEIVRGVLAEEARAVLRLYEGRLGRTYNG
jgi:hypothetical protein